MHAHASILYFFKQIHSCSPSRMTSMETYDASKLSACQMTIVSNDSDDCETKEVLRVHHYDFPGIVRDNVVANTGLERLHVHRTPHVVASLRIHTILSVNPLPNKPWFLRVCSTLVLKTLWEKEKLLVTSNFSISLSVFYPF